MEASGYSLVSLPLLRTAFAKHTKRMIRMPKFLIDEAETSPCAITLPVTVLYYSVADAVRGDHSYILNIQRRYCANKEFKLILLLLRYKIAF